MRARSPMLGKPSEHVARRDSPAAWLGLISPLTSDEAIIWGAVHKQDARDYGETICLAFSGRSEIKRVEVRLHLRHGKCLRVETTIHHTFWRAPRVFSFPPMKARDLVDLIWTSITQAQTRLNVDPVALARESLGHGKIPEYVKPDSSAFGILLAAWHEE